MYGFFQDLYPHRAWRKARQEGEVLLATNHNLEMIYLNETASVFLSFCDGETKLSAIVDKMLSEFDVDRNTLRDDLSILIRDLQWKNILYFSKTPRKVSC